MTKEYDALGRRTSFSAAKGTQSIISNSYTYDVLGRLTAVTNGEDTAAYTYDANSNRLTTTVNGVLKSSTAYNKANLPTEVNSYVSGALKSTETYRYAYSGYIQHYSKVEPQGNTSGVTYYYDNGGRMYAERSSCSDTITNETVYRCSNRFVYDEYGNVSKFIYNNRYSDNLYQCDYTYNNINQLTAFCKVEIIYDEDGNFTGNSITTNTAYTYDNSNNLTTVTQDGEVIKTYSYDGFNRMSGALVNGVASSYTYDGDNLRQTKTVNGVQTQHILDGADVIADISGESIKTFVRGAELEFLKTSGGATQEYMTSYPRGDVRYLISQDGTVNDYTYTAYGEKVGTNDNTVNPFGYCGEYFDAETDLVYLRNRYYDPEMHRFIAEDPAKDGVNWYAYCSNDPVNNVDPDGTVSKKKASAVITRNAEYIKNAGSYYNVNPAIIAACIYTEQIKNVNIIDTLTDVPGYFVDTSIGIGQVKVSTAKLLEDNGYIAPTTFAYSYDLWHTNWYVTKEVWYAPTYGYVEGSREKAIAYRLTVEGENVNYVAAYLAFYQDRWKSEYPQIDGKTDILATLFNQGERYEPHSDPKPNAFGKEAKKQYSYMQELLGIK